MTQFKWTISAFDIKPESKIITNIHWILSAERDETNVETYGCTSLPEPTDKIIDYDLITKEQVVIWLESALSIASYNIEELTQLETIKQYLEKAIDEELKPIFEKTIPNFI